MRPCFLFTSPSPELGGSWHILDLLKLGAHFDDAVSDQPGVQTHGSP